ncbi:hypothetical protein M2152_001796 [Microbacteriaceae bacterium SG_E_30_P1]|uniref:Uncharacterized protein n=1 Tax=Antiquaquibacter oligotrophicus TaxID=2880260 RepID=A0ABT6KQY6_9MICO|nr:hypothetical protein [Antiquaquibacter oligotrophicus]MDH6181614.1 hypothetical protein [Antiquaquibacter oligotrophicus]UDF12701.1 hypothetical protein LH407_11120 [Antiquaquibacter oligotrophicus]
MVERHSAAVQASEADQQAVFELLREQLFRMFGPGGSFRITLGRATADDTVFVETVADTIAWDVTASLTSSHGEGSHAADPVTAQAAHEELWRHIERELLLRRTGPQSIDVEVEREIAAAGIRSVHAA